MRFLSNSYHVSTIVSYLLRIRLLKREPCEIEGSEILSAFNKTWEIHAFPIYQKSKVPREHFRIPLGLARCRKKYQLQHTLIHLLFVTMMIHVEKAIPMSHKIHGCRPPQKHDREKKEFPKKGSFVRRLPIFVHNKLSFRIFIAN